MHKKSAEWTRLCRKTPQSSKSAGFTLIETLVVIGIMSVLSAMLIAYNHSSTAQLALTTDQANVAGVLNRAKALALEKYNVPGVSGQICAYGVSFSSTSTYFIYGYTPQSGSQCSTATDFSYSSLNGFIVQNFQLDAGIQFNPIPADIYFIPPYLVASSSGAMAVTLQIPANGATAGISVSPGGGVSF